MSEDKKEKNDGGSGGLGIGAAVLVGAGVTALGFMARDLWNSYQECQSQSSDSQPRPPPLAPPTTEWESKSDETSDKKMGARKKHREACKDQNLPDEMKCVVCLDNPREICLVPCGHVCMCEDCADKISDTCPMCKAHIMSKKVVYIAVLVAAGAGAIGFMAGEFWGAYQACKAYMRAPPTTEWENRPSKTPDKNMGTRKKNRESCKDQNLPDEMKCIICVDNPREICLVPCGHVCLCEDCADKISNTCPMCKTRTVDKKPIYM